MHPCASKSISWLAQYPLQFMFTITLIYCVPSSHLIHLEYTGYPRGPELVNNARTCSFAGSKLHSSLSVQTGTSCHRALICCLLPSTHHTSISHIMANLCQIDFCESFTDAFLCAWAQFELCHKTWWKGYWGASSGGWEETTSPLPPMEMSLWR